MRRMLGWLYLRWLAVKRWHTGNLVIGSTLSTADGHEFVVIGVGNGDEVVVRAWRNGFLTCSTGTALITFRT